LEQLFFLCTRPNTCPRPNTVAQLPSVSQAAGTAPHLERQKTAQTLIFSNNEHLNGIISKTVARVGLLGL
jgi:hypothetical protein